MIVSLIEQEAEAKVESNRIEHEFEKINAKYDTSHFEIQNFFQQHSTLVI